MNGSKAWMTSLNEHDADFVKTFVLASGSLKELARVYGVSYPTIRARLDRVIEKLEVTEGQDDRFIVRVRGLAIDRRIPTEVIDSIIDVYREEAQGNV